MHILEQIRFVCYILLFLPLPITIWTTVVGAFGIKKTKSIPKSDKKSRFAVLVCAKDEEKVIGQLIDSLNVQNYDRNLYTVFVAADNCTDNTAKVARQHGAIAFERFDEEHKSKGYAMQWLIKRVNAGYAGEFDAFTVFDADNLVTPDFLSRTNDALQNGADITQGYRDTKNPYDSVVSGSYAIYWLLLMRFFHCARANLGLSCMVGGTGYAFRAELVKEGFKSKTLTEDVEFSMKSILMGRKIVPVCDAVFFDEQPTDYKTSITQRFRWLVGNIQCATNILPNMSKYKKEAKQNSKVIKASRIDAFFYMLSTYAFPISTLLGIVYAVLSLVVEPHNWVNTLRDAGLMLLLTCVVISLIALLTVVVEHKPVMKYLGAILFFPLFIIPLSFMSIPSLNHRDLEWKQIKHNCTKEITEVSEYVNVA